MKRQSRGSYRCVALNTVGQGESDEFYLKVLCKPLADNIYCRLASHVAFSPPSPTRPLRDASLIRSRASVPRRAEGGLSRGEERARGGELRRGRRSR